LYWPSRNCSSTWLGDAMVKRHAKSLGRNEPSSAVLEGLLAQPGDPVRIGIRLG
jgi:hypothetical protein